MPESTLTPAQLNELQKLQEQRQIEILKAQQTPAPIPSTPVPETKSAPPTRIEPNTVQPPTNRPLPTVQSIPKQEGNPQETIKTTAPGRIAQPAQQIAPKPTDSSLVVLPEKIDKRPDGWEAQLTKRFEELRKFYMGYAGKVGCNPYFFLHKKVYTAEAIFKARGQRFEYFDMFHSDKKTTPEVITKEQWESQLYYYVMQIEMKEQYAMHDPQSFQLELDRRQAEKTRILTGQRIATVQ